MKWLVALMRAVASYKTGKKKLPPGIKLRQAALPAVSPLWNDIARGTYKKRFTDLRPADQAAVMRIAAALRPDKP